MTASGFQFDCLLDPRLAPHAASARPVWLWSADASRILWANPTGAAIFGAATPADLQKIQLDSSHAARTQVTRLAASLVQDSAPRLERLRGFGARVGGLLTCNCSLISLGTHGNGVLVIAGERAGPEFSLAETARRLLAGNTSPVSAYDAEGKLLHQTDGTEAVSDLAAIDAQTIVADALKNGAASGTTQSGKLSLARIGDGGNTILLATIDKPAAIPQTPDAAASAPVIANVKTEAVIPAGKAPLRFVWQIDETSRFTIEPGEFIRLIGPVTAATFNRPWTEIAAALRLDSAGSMARALAARETFSGILVPWPVDGSHETLPVEMSGLPVFGREREFRGYRGFGICRDVARLDALATAREFLPPAFLKPQAITASPENIVPFPAIAVTAPVAATPSPVAEKPVTTPMPAAAQDNAPPPTLSPVEKLAFRELARRLGDGLRQSTGKAPSLTMAPAEMQTQAAPQIYSPPPQPLADMEADASSVSAIPARSEASILDRIPFGVLVYRLNELLYANKAFLDWTGYANLHELTQAGGLDTLFIDGADGSSAQNGTPLTISTQDGGRVPLEGRLFSTTWNDESALVLMVNITTPVAASTPLQTAPSIDESRLREAEAALRKAQDGARELESILDTATDGVVVIDRDGRILSGNHSAQALFGYDEKDFNALLFGDLFAPESRRAALDYLDRLGSAGSVALINEGREVMGRVRQAKGPSGLLPLFMTLGRVGDDGRKFCAVFRDLTAWKKNEEELLVARRKAETSSTAKSEFLAKISHEMRSPLNAIIGFSEVMIGERFGPVGSERYRDYLKDIHASGEHLIALLNDLLDLSRIETGKLDLTFASLHLNDLTQQCVAILQPQANRNRVIIRTAFAPSLPQIVADARAVRQIVLNVLSSALKMTGAGGQVIVSTAATDEGDIALRVRDSGGMSERELAQALDPFHELSTTPRWGASGTGLGLPITKALTEANHARFRIASNAETGTLIEIVFPATRVLAE
jgi:PAS domain S-box-containing protein